MSKSKKTTVCLPVTVVMGSETYAPGVPVPVDEATAAELRARYREVPEVPVAAAAAPRKPRGAALVSAIAEAIQALDPEDEESFTAAGLPVIAVLEKALGYDITADDRAAALASIEASGGGQLAV